MTSEAIPVRVPDANEKKAITERLKNDELGPDYSFISHWQNTTWQIIELNNEYIIVWNDEVEVACRSLTVAMNWVITRLY